MHLEQKEPLHRIQAALSRLLRSAVAINRQIGTHLGAGGADVEWIAGADETREFLVHVLRAAHLKALRPLCCAHIRLRHLLGKMPPACSRQRQRASPTMPAHFRDCKMEAIRH